MLSPDPEIVLAALCQDPVYGKPDAFVQVKDVVAALPQILAEYMEQVVTPQRFLEAMLLTCQELAKKSACLDEEIAGVLASLKEWSADPALAFAFAGTTEADFLLSDHVGLAGSLKLLLEDGRLMFADIIQTQPGIFLP